MARGSLGALRLAAACLRLVLLTGTHSKVRSPSLLHICGWTAQQLLSRHSSEPLCAAVRTDIFISILNEDRLTIYTINLEQRITELNLIAEKRRTTNQYFFDFHVHKGNSKGC